MGRLYQNLKGSIGQKIEGYIPYPSPTQCRSGYWRITFAKKGGDKYNIWLSPIMKELLEKHRDKLRPWAKVTAICSPFGVLFFLGWESDDSLTTAGNEYRNGKYYFPGLFDAMNNR